MIHPDPSTSEPTRRTLGYRKPFHFDAVLAHLASQRVGRLERIEAGAYHRLVERDGATGWVTVRNDPERARVVIESELSDSVVVSDALARTRAMFDLDVDPAEVARALGLDPELKRLLAKHPGLRVGTGWDPFELGVATILGQLVSVPRGRALTEQLIEIAGRESGRRDAAGPIKLFPRPIDLARADLTRLGSTGRRKATLNEFARRVATGELSLDADQDAEAFTARLLEIPGIGPWTAAYVGMKVLRHADAFPATDLILARALARHPKLAIERVKPWRAYAAILLWREYAEILSRPKKGSS